MEEGLRSALRHRTRHLHTRLDDSLAGPDGQVTDLSGYVRLLRTMHALHAVADRPLARWARTSALAAPLRVAALPDRAPSYAADLVALGEPVPASADEGAPGPSDARGVALLYLLAGSAAGARLVLRGLPATVPDGARRGLTDAAAPASTRLWRETCALLEGGTVPDGLHEATVAEACEVMEWLLELPLPVAS